MPFEPSRSEQLTEKNLNLGYWWVTNKIKVRQWTAVAIAVVDFVLVGYGAFGFADWFFGSGAVERQQLGQLTERNIDYGFFREKFAPQPAGVDSAQTLFAGENTSDFFARVTNPNPRWWLDIAYHFDSSAGSTASTRTFVLPGETMTLSALGVRADAQPSGAQLVVDSQHWVRVDQHKTRPDYETWAAMRLGMRIDQPVFVPPSPNDAVAVSRVRFKITNDTGFGYYKVGFFITAMSGGAVVGVNKVTISELRPGQSRDVEASWFNDLPAVNNIEVKPELNIFDDRNYIPPGQ